MGTSERCVHTMKEETGCFNKAPPDCQDLFMGFADRRWHIFPRFPSLSKLRLQTYLNMIHFYYERSGYVHEVCFFHRPLIETSVAP